MAKVLAALNLFYCVGKKAWGARAFSGNEGNVSLALSLSKFPVQAKIPTGCLHQVCNVAVEPVPENSNPIRRHKEAPYYRFKPSLNIFHEAAIDIKAKFEQKPKCSVFLQALISTSASLAKAWNVCGRWA